MIRTMAGLLLFFIQTGSMPATIHMETSAIDSLPSLKNHFNHYFTMGVAVSPRSLKTDEAYLILNQFSSLTAENAMKMGPIHPKEDLYNWSGADSIAIFARRNGLKLRGHTLCWHNQTPSWLFLDSTGKNPVTKEVLLERLQDHIKNVVTRYKGTIYAWDVVNEAISDNADEYLRNSSWLKICGEEYIRKAFEWAHEADPDALLFYNDYNTINPVKREKIIRLLKDLQSRGVPIHGIGIQGHWSYDEPGKEQLEKTLSDFLKLGLTIQITELDLSIYHKEHQARATKPQDADSGFTSQKEAAQVKQYKMIFSLFEKYHQQISAITFWNVSDRHSWLDNFPVRGRKDYPLLFDKNLQPKMAFKAIVH